MSVTRLPPHAKPEDLAALREEDTFIRWLEERLVLAKDRRRKIMNRCSARAYLDRKRGGRKPRKYEWSGQP